MLSAVITLKANIQKATYKVTLVDGDVTATKEIATTEDAATQIKITSTQALTDEARSEAYIYYDVIDQYGESIRKNSSITWTVSTPACDDNVNDGRLTVFANAAGAGTTNTFVFGSDIVVVGVDTAAQLTVQETVKVGMPQALDTIEFKGFVDLKGDKTKLLDTLPTNFGFDRYVLAFSAFDQDGHEMTGDIVVNDNVIFVSSNPMLIAQSDLEYKDKDRTPVLKIAGKKYYTVAVNPGQYANKGGEVDIQAISKRTGGKKNQNYVIGAVPVLKSFKLGLPEYIHAGDINLTVPFTATDSNGNTLTNYEAIVRSSNQLSLTCSRGTLVLAEQDDGTAKLTWSDTTENKKLDWNTGDIMNKDIQNTIWTSMVIGAEGTMDTKNVKIQPARMPSNIVSVKMPATVVSADAFEIKIADNDNDNKIFFCDQDGNNLTKEEAHNFFSQVYNADAADGCRYDVSVKTDDTRKIFTVSEGAIMASGQKFTAQNKTGDTSVEFVYQIVKYKSGVGTPVGDEYDGKKCAVITMTDAKNKHLTIHGEYVPTQVVSLGAFDKYDNIKTAILAGKVTGATATSASTLNMEAKISDEITLAASSIDFVHDSHSNWWKNTNGWYNIVAGADIAVGTELFEVAPDSVVTPYVAGGMTKNAVWAVTGKALTWGDLYDKNGDRKIAKLALKLQAKGDDSVTVSTKIAVSNEPAKLATMELVTNYDYLYVDGANVGWAPTCGEITVNTAAPWGYVTDAATNYDKPNLIYKDQYGKVMDKRLFDDDVTFTVTELKEAETELTHVPGNLKIKSGQGTKELKLEGAEVGDTFKLTISCGDKSVEYKVTVKADKSANLEAKSTMTDHDKDLRKVLKYEQQ